GKPMVTFRGVLSTRCWSPPAVLAAFEPKCVGTGCAIPELLTIALPACSGEPFAEAPRAPAAVGIGLAATAPSA
ncbi:MAG TPA: hypothetical protein VJW93_09555, partial [Candidatus Acidoferrales bacterium]|nr:hypothetical protein [Candidatus Acidoferrales bacterium]